MGKQIAEGRMKQPTEIYGGVVEETEKPIPDQKYYRDEEGKERKW